MKLAKKEADIIQQKWNARDTKAKKEFTVDNYEFESEEMRDFKKNIKGYKQEETKRETTRKETETKQEGVKEAKERGEVISSEEMKELKDKLDQLEISGDTPKSKIDNLRKRLESGKLTESKLEEIKKELSEAKTGLREAEERASKAETRIPIRSLTPEQMNTGMNIMKDYAKRDAIWARIFNVMNNDQKKLLIENIMSSDQAQANPQATIQGFMNLFPKKDIQLSNNIWSGILNLPEGAKDAMNAFFTYKKATAGIVGASVLAEAYTNFIQNLLSIYSKNEIKPPENIIKQEKKSNALLIKAFNEEMKKRQDKVKSADKTEEIKQTSESQLNKLAYLQKQNDNLLNQLSRSLKGKKLSLTQSRIQEQINDFSQKLSKSNMTGEQQQYETEKFINNLLQEELRAIPSKNITEPVKQPSDETKPMIPSKDAVGPVPEIGEQKNVPEIEKDVPVPTLSKPEAPLQNALKGPAPFLNTYLPTRRLFVQQQQTLTSGASERTYVLPAKSDIEKGADVFKKEQAKKGEKIIMNKTAAETGLRNAVQDNKYIRQTLGFSISPFIL